MSDPSPNVDLGTVKRRSSILTAIVLKQQYLREFYNKVDNFIGQNPGALPIKIIALRMRKELHFATSGSAVRRMMRLQDSRHFNTILCLCLLWKMQK